MNRKLIIFLSIVIALVLALAIGWNIGSDRADSELRDLALAEEFYKIGMFANTLNLMSDSKHEKVVNLNSKSLEWSIDHAEELLQDGASLGGLVAPNLRDSLLRARKYYEKAGKSGFTKRIDKIVETIDGE